MAEHEVGNVGAFILALQERGLRTAVLAWRQEYGQHPDPGAVRYERLQLATLLGYDRATGTIVRCALDGADRAAVRAQLETAGLTVEERSRNTV